MCVSFKICVIPVVVNLYECRLNNLLEQYQRNPFCFKVAEWLCSVIKCSLYWAFWQNIHDHFPRDLWWEINSPLVKHGTCHISLSHISWKFYATKPFRFSVFSCMGFLLGISVLCVVDLVVMQCSDIRSWGKMMPELDKQTPMNLCNRKWTGDSRKA